MKRDEEMKDIEKQDCCYCLCNSCINNVESLTVKIEEIPSDAYPCFICDECYMFDGNDKNKNMSISECDRYIIDNYHAIKNRMQIKIVK